jgi:hypothetical protein
MTNSFYLSELIGIPILESFAQAAKDRELKELSDSLYAKASTAKREELLSPTVVFENTSKLTRVKSKNSQYYEDAKEFYVSLGIFKLDTTSATATITKDNKLELTWTERAGKGKFSSKIPNYLVATSAPILSYEGGVLDIRVPVESRSKNETVFIGKLESK